MLAQISHAQKNHHYPYCVNFKPNRCTAALFISQTKKKKLLARIIMRKWAAFERRAAQYFVYHIDITLAHVPRTIVIVLTVIYIAIGIFD